VCAAHLQLRDARVLLFNLQRLAMLRIHHFSPPLLKKQQQRWAVQPERETSHMQNRKHVLAKHRVASMVTILCIAKVCAVYDRQPTSDLP
jgi:hypothetical protein